MVAKIQNSEYSDGRVWMVGFSNSMAPMCVSRLSLRITPTSGLPELVGASGGCRHCQYLRGNKHNDIRSIGMWSRHFCGRVFGTGVIFVRSRTQSPMGEVCAGHFEVGGYRLRRFFRLAVECSADI